MRRRNKWKSIAGLAFLSVVTVACATDSNGHTTAASSPLQQMVAEFPAGRMVPFFLGDPEEVAWRADEEIDRAEALKFVGEALDRYPVTGYWPVMISDPEDNPVDRERFEYASVAWPHPNFVGATWSQSMDQLRHFNIDSGSSTFLFLVPTDTPYALLGATSFKHGRFGNDTKAWMRSLTPLVSLPAGPIEIVASTYVVAAPDIPQKIVSVSEYSQILKEVDEAQGSASNSPFTLEGKKFDWVAWED